MCFFFCKVWVSAGYAYKSTETLCTTRIITTHAHFFLSFLLRSSKLDFYSSAGLKYQSLIVLILEQGNLSRSFPFQETVAFAFIYEWNNVCSRNSFFYLHSSALLLAPLEFSSLVKTNHSKRSEEGRISAKWTLTTVWPGPKNIFVRWKKDPEKPALDQS
jgi:hypothetical protein